MRLLAAAGLRESRISWAYTTVEVTHSDAGETDPGTGHIAPPVQTVSYRGAALIRSRRRLSSTDLQGGETEIRAGYDLILPSHAPSPAAGDVVRVSASENADLRGRILRVAELAGDSRAHSRQVVCELVTVVPRT